MGTEGDTASPLTPLWVAFFQEVKTVSTLHIVIHGHVLGGRTIK